MKKFNVTGACRQEIHYMADISDRLCQMKEMIDDGKYFVINRARQYGKTTTLSLLKKKLEEEYIVFFISFEGLGEEQLDGSSRFAKSFLQLLKETIDFGETILLNEQGKQFLEESAERCDLDFLQLANIISMFCSMTEKPVVLLVDEVDQAGNYKSFLDFLGMLRSKFLKRDTRPTFQSVILAGVYDITNLKLKIRNENEHQYNSPWNIASAFTLSMNFDTEQIGTMLEAYDADHHIGMDTKEVAQCIFDYTSGYPYMVSRICMLMDEADMTWSVDGVKGAVKVLLTESNTLFDDMRKKLNDYPELRSMLYDILFLGKEYPHHLYQNTMNMAEMFGYIDGQSGKVEISNRIFETWLYNLFVSDERMSSLIYNAGATEKSQFVENGHLNMQRILERFVVHFTDMYGDKDEKFIEEVGRKYFLFYLKPIINGTGNYYVEAQTRDAKRTDVVVDYHGEQFVVEMKIWHGEEYNRRGEQQLIDYLNAYHLDKGYMLSFNFNKNKEVGVKELQIDGKTIIEAIV